MLITVTLLNAKLFCEIRRKKKAENPLDDLARAKIPNRCTETDGIVNSASRVISKINRLPCREREHIQSED